MSSSSNIVTLLNSNLNPLTLPVSLNPPSLVANPAVASSSLSSSSPSSNPVGPSVRLSTGSNNTYVMSGSPRRNIRKRSHEPYLPKIITTVGQRPACLVNASVTYVGKDEIYAFGGFDQFTDEVYNHVLRLNLTAKQWNLVDNYGDIPGVRMGHTACLWQNDKLLVFGGENEHRAHLSDVIIFDLTSAHWTQPEIHGVPPRGRARHSAVLHNDKLFVSGGMTGHDNAVLDDISYLDLKTWTWSRPWRFVPRYDHSTWIWGGRLWVSGGMTEEMERTPEIWWLDLKGIPAFDGAQGDQVPGTPTTNARSINNYGPAPPMPPGGYTANSSSVQMTPGHMMHRSVPMAPGSISSLKFISSPNLPVQNVGIHFHVFSSGCLLDFVTPASPLSALETSLSAFDLDTLRWQKLADGKHLFNPNYRWHYCCLDADGTNAWLLGCPNQVRNGQNNDSEEYLSDVLHLDLRKLGLLGNKMTTESRVENAALPASDSHIPSHLSAIGADLARTFDIAPEHGSGADYIITAEPDDDYEYGDRGQDDDTAATLGRPEKPANRSSPIHVHRFILSARWPHFQRALSHRTIEYHTNTMHIPEPYSAVRAFLYYLYTDSIAPAPASSSASDVPISSPSLEDVAGMLVMSNIYDMPRLHHLCVARLSRELDIQHAALIFAQASLAQEHWLKRRAASYCMTHWGRVVRTDSFKRLSKEAMLELCEEIDAEGRVVGGDELEAVGGLGGARLGGLGGLYGIDGRKRRLNSINTVGEEEESLEDEGMEIA